MARSKKDILQQLTKPFTKAKIIANNTLRIDYTDGTSAIRLHNTDIITTTQDGATVLDTNGWQTVTTKDRINAFSPVRIHQKNYVWYLQDGTEYYDGVIVH